jgi:hypothetical protein
LDEGIFEVSFVGILLVKSGNSLTVLDRKDGRELRVARIEANQERGKIPPG